MKSHSSYRSPLEGRYSSARMQAIWSPHRRYSTWRRLWLALAESQQQLGLPITDEQVAQLREHLDDIDEAAAGRHEASTRHDVMAHILALGEVAPLARPIIHLGATSQYVNCNTELILIRDALQVIAGRLARLIDALGRFAETHRGLPTLGFTHYQPAQPTTVGKRATLWAYDLALALEDVEHRLDTLRFRGVKGATGTQASFLALFDGNHDKVERLDEMVCDRMGWPRDRRLVVTGQTYPRLIDAQVLGTLASIAACVTKWCNDLRLLANLKEIEEPFNDTQVGSSSMPYKRNPMLAERATGLLRFVMSMASNATMTAAAQWFERTLDDSANRRLSLPEAFLALDGALLVMEENAGGMVVYERTIAANLAIELPFLASENLLMAAVEAGADRQVAHEVLRGHSRAAAEALKAGAARNDLFERLRGEVVFADLVNDGVLDPLAYVGRAPQQVEQFLNDVVEPIRARYADQLAQQDERPAR